ncbi:hypothetical protein GCM10018783_10890 [Streptomyces griseosporeus]|nr:hypothetical protein GCM10018783_10890 [Streptomyces griseosporeus]
MILSPVRPWDLRVPGPLCTGWPAVLTVLISGLYVVLNLRLRNLRVRSLRSRKFPAPARRKMLLRFHVPLEIP